MTGSEAQAAARRQRDELYDTILALETALSAPTAGRPQSWARRVGDALGAMSSALDNHVTVTEGPGGLFDEIMSREPRLAHAINRLRDEHQPFVDTVTATQTRLRAVDDPEDVEEVRATLLGLVHGLLVHRHRGAELVYEAYNVDVSAGD